MHRASRIAREIDTLAVLDTQPVCDITREIWLTVHPHRVCTPSHRIADAVRAAEDNL